MMCSTSSRFPPPSSTTDRCDADVTLRRAEPRDGVESFIDLCPAEWEIVTLIDGMHSLRDIAAELALSEFEVAKTVSGMLSTELIEIMQANVDAAA